MKYALYAGGYGNESLARLTFQDGTLKPEETYPAVNASYLCLSPDEKHLYTVGETQRFRGEYGGSVQSYDIDPMGRLTQTSIRPTHGADPCHLTLIGDILLATNYTSGSLSRYPIGSDGRIGEMLPLIFHKGSGPRANRQSGPHMHQVLLTPGGYFAVTDLGIDAICFYPAPELASEAPAAVRVNTPAGFGPRHCAFLRGSDVWYVACELESQLLVYRGAPGNAMLIGRAPIGGIGGVNYPAALRLSPDQRLLAATGRGRNEISLFSIGDNGLPSLLTEVSCRGDWPRDVQFTPDGKYLVCANERSDTLTVFAIADGHLEYCGAACVKAPACVEFSKHRQEV